MNDYALIFIGNYFLPSFVLIAIVLLFISMKSLYLNRLIVFIRVNDSQTEDFERFIRYWIFIGICAMLNCIIPYFIRNKLFLLESSPNYVYGLSTGLMIWPSIHMVRVLKKIRSEKEKYALNVKQIILLGISSGMISATFILAFILLMYSVSKFI